MECPECEEELQYVDFYGRNLHLDSFGRVKDGFEKEGDIFKCKNEHCTSYEEFFRTSYNGELRYGYPC